MGIYFVESTLLYNDLKGFGEAYYIVCPVCWNASVMFKYWEDGSEEAGECLVCERTMRALSGSDEERAGD